MGKTAGCKSVLQPADAERGIHSSSFSPLRCASTRAKLTPSFGTANTYFVLWGSKATGGCRETTILSSGTCGPGQPGCETLPMSKMAFPS